MRFKILILLFCVVTVCAFSQQQDELYQGKPISDIVFTGLRNITQNELDGLVNPYKGRNFSDDLYWELSGKLWALEYFERIEPGFRLDTSGNGVIIRFTVIERPVITRINFVGNSGLRPADLRDVITSKVNDVVNPVKIRGDIEAIKNKYTEKGYPNATVETSEIQNRDMSITLVFNIKEGEKISISAFEFQGNTKFTSKKLAGQLSLKKKGLLNDGAFQESKLIADREAITNYYHDRGYIDMEIKDVTRTFDTDDKGTNMTITFLIEEGNLYTFGGVTFEGNVIFTDEQLAKLISSKVGETVNMGRLETDLQRVSDLYYENGYIFNSIIRVPEKTSLPNVLSFEISIVERGRAHIENIVIIGNEKTKTEVILREIPLEPGDVFSRTKVMDAMRNLYNLQFFTVIFPETPQGSAESLMDLVFTVEEQPTTDVQFGLTFSGSADPDTFPISGMIKWNDRNLFGSGNQLGAELNSSIRDNTSFSINYLQRWIFGLPLSGGFDLSINYSNRLSAMDNHFPIFNGNEEYAYPDGFYSYEEYFANNKIPPRDYLMDLKQLYISLGFSSGYLWTTFLGNLSLNGGIRFGIIRNNYDQALFRPFDPALRERNNQWTPKNSFWLSVSLDQRDIFYDPSRGYYFYERMGFYGILSSEREHFIRSDTKAEYFYTLFDLPVTEKWNFKGVLALHSAISFIFKQPGRDSDRLTPSIEDGSMLSVDGMFVGRGWSNAYYNKGFVLWDNWVEVRFPLVQGILAFDLFFDAAGVETTKGYYFGTNNEGQSNFTVNNMRYSFGGGFRFTMPQFPFRLSLAKRFRFEDDKFKWEPGALFGDGKTTGVDLVISFVLSY